MQSVSESRKVFTGLSSETKPTQNVPAYSRFLEQDTSNEYEYDGDTWVQKVTGGAGNQFASATSGAAVTPSDATVLNFKALWIGVTGDVSVDHTEGGTAVVYTNVPVGWFPVAGVRVNAATTAEAIVAVSW